MNQNQKDGETALGLLRSLQLYDARGAENGVLASDVSLVTAALRLARHELAQAYDTGFARGWRAGKRDEPPPADGADNCNPYRPYPAQRAEPEQRGTPATTPTSYECTKQNPCGRCAVCWD